jgi:hypothetical protein
VLWWRVEVHCLMPLLGERDANRIGSSQTIEFGNRCPTNHFEWWTRGFKECSRIGGWVKEIVSGRFRFGSLLFNVAAVAFASCIVTRRWLFRTVHVRWLLKHS